MATRYVLDFGTANTGGSPTWLLYARTDSLAALSQPTLTEIGATGMFYWDVDWPTSPTTSITFKATLGGIELMDVISQGDVASSGSTSASAFDWSLSGYDTVANAINNAAVECGLESVADPYASTDPNFVQLRRLLNSVGLELAQEIRAHLRRVCTITTAGSATSYALPTDFVEMIPGTGWDASGLQPMRGPVSPRESRYITVWDGAATISIPFEVRGNRITFPVAPADGLSLSFLYVSRYWIQTAASGTGPDAERATAGTDYVLFDPLLVVRGLKVKWLTAKGLDNVQALAEFNHRKEYIKGTNASAPVLSLVGPTSGFRFIDEWNVPETGYGT